MKKSVFALSAAVLVLFLIIFIVKNNQARPPILTRGKLPVSASFYPLAYFAEQIGDKSMSVITIVPAGSEPHEYEPTPHDIVSIRSSRLFIYNGAGLDPWAEKIAPDLGTKNIALINITQDIPLITSQPHDESPFDPHVWVDPVLAQNEVQTIASAFISIDPSNEKTYQKNAGEFSQRLATLDQEYKKGLTNCQLREVIVSHNAFGYLGLRYNFIIHPIAGLSPEEEPSPKKIAELTLLAKEKGIKYIFFETLVSSRLAETIAREVGADTLVLDPLEGIPAENEKQGENYETIMRENLVNLQKAMQCQ